MELDQFSVEVLMKIFSYLPTYGSVLLVNKYFYNVASIVRDSKICLRLDSRFFVRIFFCFRQIVRSSNLVMN